jgi:hypothetical protein
MLRREFFSFASGAAVSAPDIVKSKPKSLAALVSEIRPAIQNDMPDVTSIEVTYDPEDRKVPLMILAFRV